MPGGGGGAQGVLGRAVASPRDDVTRAGHGARGPAPRRRVAGGGGRRRRATSGSGIAWWWSGRPVAAAVIIRWRPGRADPPGPRVDDITAAARGEAPGGGISTRSNRRGACDKGGFEDHGRGDRRPAPPRPEAAASSSRPSRVAPSRTSADTSSRGIRSLLSRGVAVPPDVRPWQARRPNVPGDHFPVPGTTVIFPEFVIQPIAVILPTSQTYPILREFSGVSRKKNNDS